MWCDVYLEEYQVSVKSKTDLFKNKSINLSYTRLWDMLHDDLLQII